jgi:uncharacterized membrane protein YphA (DoxX/SURF4 family)
MRRAIQTAIATLRAAEWMPMTAARVLIVFSSASVMILVWLIFSGPGRYSIDGLIARRAGAWTA